MKQIIINMLAFSIKGELLLLFIINSQKKVPESFISIKLLNHTVHIANIP